jgi:predicted DNA-binding transcriptional regulator AlpA
MASDPYPRQVLLTREQVQELLGYSRSGFGEWLESPSGSRFPRPVEIGRTKTGRPIHRWRKAQVLAFVTLLE